MITSALISQCRREFNDVPKSTESARLGDGTSTVFNVGRYPVIENSYSVYFDSVGQTETSDFTLDKDSGDLQTVMAQSNGVEILMNFKYANFRDAHWVEAINHGIQSLNARGFFRQTVNELIYISANSRSFSGPTNCVDAYQLTYAATSGTYRKLPWNWSYQQDANKFVMGSVSSSKLSGLVSYLRNLRTYTATSATLDILDDWVELVKLRAGEYYFRHMASKIATQGAATIDEGHFSFTNIRTMANDMGGSFSEMATRKKPTRPAKDVQWHIPTGGVT